MDNCYGKKDRIPRELLHNKGDRLTNSHIQTLSFLQDIINENELLKKRKEELEKEQEKCQEIHALAEDSALRINDIEENCLKRADEVNQVLSDQHRTEMMEVLDEKMETERSLKEEILKLRHELESLQRTTTVLQEDTEWLKDKQGLQSRITELELLAEGLQIDVDDKKSQRSRLQTSLNTTQAHNSQLHQLQDLRTLNQTLGEELKETEQKNQEYARKIQQLERQLRESSTEEEEHGRLTEALRNKTTKLQGERDTATLREEEARLQCRDLSTLGDGLRRKVEGMRQECVHLQQEADSLRREQGRLHRGLQHQDKDREFWAAQRELEDLKQENQALSLKVTAAASASVSLASASSSASCSLSLLKDDQTLQGRGSRPGSGSRPKKGRKKKLLSVDSSFGDGSPSPHTDL